MNVLRTLLPTLLLLAAVLVAPNGANAQARNASRVDFDDQLVQGQVNRGAVHLIERKDSDLGSLVKVRKSYRKEILAGTAVEAAEEPAKPAADIVAPKGLPVVKPAETSEAPKAEAKVEPAKAAAKAAAPKAKVAKKISSKSKSTSKSNGGNRVVSRR